MPAKTTLILNPNAGGGSAKKQWKKVSKKLSFLEPFDLLTTQRKGDGGVLAKQALNNGAQKILVAGGDGSVSEVLTGFFNDEGGLINPQAWLGTLPLGSGCDFIKSFGIFNRDQAIESLKKLHVQPCDVGKAKFTNMQNLADQRYFLNIASFGCSGKAAREVNQSKKTLGLSLTYLAVGLKTFLGYKNPTVTLQLDDQEPTNHLITSVFICNGKYSGGGMIWGPRASVTDGLLDLTILSKLSKLTGLLCTNKIYKGKVLEVKGIEAGRCKTLFAKSQEEVFIELDGEDVGKLPVEFSLSSHKINFWV